MTGRGKLSVGVKIDVKPEPAGTDAVAVALVAAVRAGTGDSVAALETSPATALTPELANIRAVVAIAQPSAMPRRRWRFRAVLRSMSVPFCS